MDKLLGMNMDQLIEAHEKDVWPWERRAIERMIVFRTKIAHAAEKTARQQRVEKLREEDLDIVEYLASWASLRVGDPLSGAWGPVLNRLLLRAKVEIERLRATIKILHEQQAPLKEAKLRFDWSAEFDEMAENVPDEVVNAINTRDDAFKYATGGGRVRSHGWVDNFADALFRRAQRQRQLAAMKEAARKGA